MAANLVANDSADLLLWNGCLTGDVRFFKWLQLLYSGLKSVISSLTMEVEVTPVVVERPER